MTTKILDGKKNKDLQAATPLWNLYRPGDAKLHFKAKTLKEGVLWQRKARTELGKSLSLGRFADAPLKPKLVEKVDKGDYFREKIIIQTMRHSAMPVYLLIPKGVKTPMPSVLAFHGHGYGVKDIVGLWEDGEERNTPDGYHKDFAVELCRKGFAVAAPEISCFGERQTDFSHLDTVIGQGVPNTCTHAAQLAFHLGVSVLGLRVYEAKRLVDYLSGREEFDCGKLCAMGISGGGMHTFFSTCVDTRIKACVVSGYFCTFRDSILGMSHCACNILPGLHEFGEIYDLAGLVAPRPMLIEAGSHDPIFPIVAVRKSVEKARKAYGVFGDARNLSTDYFEGRHQISGRIAYDFLMEHALAPRQI
ncbi:MAG: alpha/beta hydrolase family protein [Victivallales bacterium]|jgi:dienelactone hydrolase